MNQRRRHGAFFVHYYHYLVTAYDARNRTAAAVAASPAAMPADALIAIVFAALGVEAFINELAEMAQRDADMYGPALGGTATLRDLAATLAEIEDARGPVELKYQMASKILSGRTFDHGAQPFQDFRDLMRLRDALVHLRHRDRTDEAGRISPSLAVVRRLQQMGLTRTRGRGPDDVPGGMSWLNELEATGVATWAYQAAHNMVTAVGNMLPGQASMGIQFLRDMAVRLPAVPE